MLREAGCARGLLSFVSACVAVGCAASTASAASPTLEGSRLAFTAMVELRREAFSVRTTSAEGSQVAALVRGSRHGLAPRPKSRVSWSADGTRVAFAGSKRKQSGIYTIRADGTDLRFLRGTKRGDNPVFSPDGSKLAFSRLQFGKKGTFATSLWLADADGRGARRLTAFRHGVEYVPSSFSPDGSVLAVTRVGSESNKPAVLLFRLEGSRRVRVLARRASEPAFSPDGSRIVLVRYSTAYRERIRVVHKDLQVLSVNGKKIKPLTRTRFIAESYPSWDPSGERIAFIAFRISRNPFDALLDALLPFGNSIVHVNADGSCRQKILSLKGAAHYGPVWQPGPGREAGRIEC